MGVGGSYLPSVSSLIRVALKQHTNVVPQVEFLVQTMLGFVCLFILNFLLVLLPLKYSDGDWNQLWSQHSRKWSTGQPGGGGWNFTFCKEMLFTKGYFISLWVLGLGCWRSFVQRRQPESTALLRASGTFGKNCFTKIGREILPVCYHLLLLCRRTVS